MAIDTPRSADALAGLLKNTPGLIDQVKANPAMLDSLAAEVTRSLPPPAYLVDKVVYRTVVAALAIVAIAAVIGALSLAGFTNEETPDLATALGSAAIGAMAGLLAPSPGTK